MPGDGMIEVRGGIEADRFAAQLEAAGALMRERLARDLAETGHPLEAEVRARMRARMPHHGGLGDRLAERTRVTARPSVDAEGVRVTVAVGGANFEAIDRGEIHHPTFGHEPSVAQRVPAGEITEAIAHQLPEVEARAEAAVAETIEQVEGHP